MSLYIRNTNDTLSAEDFGITVLFPSIWYFWKACFHIYDLEIPFLSETGSYGLIQSSLGITLYALSFPFNLSA